MPIRVLFTLAGCACLMAVLLAPPASAKTALAELRVEGPDGTLDPGTWYVTGTEKIRKSRPGDTCVRDQGKLRFPGPTALGIAQTGSEHRKALRQVRVRLDEAGPFVCEIGSILGRPFTDPDGFAGWSYWFNDEFGSQSADLVSLKRGDQVLWVFSDFGSDPVNTDSVLELSGVPARSDGTFELEVVAHVFDGTTEPAEGAAIVGASQVTELGDGRYEVTVPDGRTTLSATRALDVPSNHVKTCVSDKPSDCPRAHGRRIFGSDKGDKIKGTRGWDKIVSGGGNDTIKLRNGGRDRVNCGAGKRDEVKLKRRDDDDRIARNCEVVKR
jgi:Domain of unknown function (DUF4430)